MKRRAALRYKLDPILTTSIGVGLATGVYGISFGALSVTAGLDVWQTQLLSLLMFSGASQFAFIGVIASGGGAAIGAAITAAWLLGVRNGFYAVSLAPILHRVGLKKIIPAQLTIDESTAVALAQKTTADQRRGFWATGIAIYVLWNLATLLGALLGDALGDPASWGLDAAAAAAFLGLLWPRLKDTKTVLTALGALVVATVLSPVLPTGASILAAGVFAVIVAWRHK
jgi:predicted branched-subunit amino acid permease